MSLGAVRPLRDLPERRGPFLAEARLRFPDDQLHGVLWCCGSCGATFTLGEIPVDEALAPHCPTEACGGVGFDTVGPATHLYD